MPDPQTPPELPDGIRGLLGRLRSRIRLYVWIEGLAAVLVTLGVAFWTGLALDWLFEPPPMVRLLGIGLVALLVLTVFYRTILRRAFARLADTSMAVLLERRFGQLDDSLLTAVELAEHGEHADSFSPQMLAHTSHEAEEAARGLSLGSVFNSGPLLRKLGLAALLALSVAALGIFARQALAVYLDRLALSEQLWPRNTRLEVQGFPPNAEGERTVKVARGGSLDLVVVADNTLPTPPPSRVEVRYVLDDGSRGRGDMRRIGQAVPGRDDYQEYNFTFQDVFESHTFDVVGGDDRVRGLRLEVVDSPEIVAMTLGCRYPGYMGLAERTLSVTGAMQIPAATEITIRGEANKDLVEVKVLDPEGVEPIAIDMTSASDRRRFTVPLPALDSDRLLLFLLRDVDGIENREPYRLALTSMPDDPPELTVRLDGIGTAITPSARIPTVGRVIDRYGIDRIWFEHVVDEGEAIETDVERQPDGVTEFDLEGVLDAKAFNPPLRPEQKLMLGVKASDRCDLAPEPNVGTGQRFLLEVVTPEKLRSLLDRRELLLRQRFETIYDEMIETRDLLARIDFTPPEDRVNPAPAPGDELEEAADDALEGAADAEEARPPVDPAQLAARAVARRRLRVARSLQNVQRAGHETLDVAAGFADIRAELINNRLDTEELKTRITDGITEPLLEIGGPRMAALAELLQALEGQADDPKGGPTAQDAALAEADEVLVEMKQVLDRMLELESYNEVVQLLRSLLRDQAQLNELTREQRKAELRRLLEEK